MINMNHLQQIFQSVTDELLEGGGTPYDINNGLCEEWANEVYNKVSHFTKAEIWATPYSFADTTHIFVRIDGKFYDAECLEGVENHNDLPIFQKLGKKQPVWCEHSNHSNTESIRDIPPALRKLIRKEQIESGVPAERALSLISR